MQTDAVLEPPVEHAPGTRPSPSKRFRPKLRYAILLTLIFLIGVAAYSYIRFTRTVDHMLAAGPFADTTSILAAPRVFRVGDAISPEDAVRMLRQSGYASQSGSSQGWFEQHASSVQIFPGASSGGAALIAFQSGKIASISQIGGGRALTEYSLHPALLVNLSGRERRRPVRFASIPKSLVNALVSVEDKRFFQHGGFDVGRMLKAAYVDVRYGRKREGASTLTMQLARSLWLDRSKSWRRKIEEILITTHLEHKLSKQQIFEDYANEIYLGQRGTFSINGFGEGARAIFGKDLSQIDTAQAATLAGLVRGPSYYNPFQYPERAVQRRNTVLALMRRNGYLTEEEYRTASEEPLALAPNQSQPWQNSYFLALVNQELRSRLGEESAHNRSVYTTLDPDLQRAAEEAVRAGMELVDKRLHQRRDRESIAFGQPQLALVALNPHTGEIKALAGGRDYAASQLNHALAKRQPGSVFKPFVYAAAIATGIENTGNVFTPATILSDEPTTFVSGNQEYQPKDFHGDFMGDVTLRTALAHSLNVATVSLAEQVGYKRIVGLARRAGWGDNLRPTPAVALGAYEATPLEVAEAYTAFANRGISVRPTTLAEVQSGDGSVLYKHVAETHGVLDPKAAYIMVNLMEEVLSTGTGAGVRAMGFTQPAAGKTGTSRDGWFAGFTTELLCIVWVGFDDNRDLGLEGAHSALPIWAGFMKRAAQLPAYAKAKPFERPSGLEYAQICTETGKLAGPLCPSPRNEVFLAGTQPEEVCDSQVHGTPVLRTGLGQ